MSALTKGSSGPSGAFPWLIISSDRQCFKGLGDVLRDYQALSFQLQEFDFPLSLKLYRLPFPRILLPTHSERIRLCLALQFIFRPS